MVWLDRFTQHHLFHGLLDREILRGTLLQQEIFDFWCFSFTNTKILRTLFKGIGAFCKRKWPVVVVGGGGGGVG